MGNPARSTRASLPLLAVALAFHPVSSPGQEQSFQPATALEEIIVTATRTDTNLQETPMSVWAATGENLELAGIDAGRDLSIMVPNVVATPGTMGERTTSMIIRGLPGVTTYVDGTWAGDWGFLQRSFVELERVEVLRGPQGTHFGRNTNGGAIQLITRKPSAEFGIRAGIELGDYSRRMAKFVADVPISDRLLTKWTLASDENDGFMDSQTAPLTLGGQDDSLVRADVMWEPTDRFSVRVVASDERRRSTDARIVRISNPDNPGYIALNVLAGNPEFLAQARAIDPVFPDPPVALAGDRFTSQTHQAGFPGGSLGKWQTMSDTLGQIAVSDSRYLTLNINRDFNENWSLEYLGSYRDPDFRLVWDRDVSEFTQYSGAGRDDPEARTHELHLVGSHFNGRVRTLLGYWYLNSEFWARVHRWVDWDFAIPSAGPTPPARNLAAVSYVRAWGATVGNPAVANYSPRTFLSADFAAHTRSKEEALFGEVMIGVADRVDLTLGFRVTEDDEGSSFGYAPTDAFRPAEPGTFGAGDPRAVGAVLGGGEFTDLGSVTSPRVSVAYRPIDDIYLYASYAEGFTQGAVVNSPFVPDPIILDPEVVVTRELGLRSDWLSGRLRLNATYFDSRWNGLRVPRQLDDPNNPGQPSPFLSVPSSDGVADSSGLELELSYLAGERWKVDFSLGLLDTEYLDVGDPPANGSGLQPGMPFPFAPDVSYALSTQYRVPVARGGEVLLVGNYGWMDEYERARTNDLQSRNPDGSRRPEPAYGLLNARVVYQPGDRNWQLSLFGTNLTDEWYVNGGEDPGLYIGYDLATIGRPREVGIGFQIAFE